VSYTAIAISVVICVVNVAYSAHALWEWWRESRPRPSRRQVNRLGPPRTHAGVRRHAPPVVHQLTGACLNVPAA
jgi:hypothetical protein